MDESLLRKLLERPLVPVPGDSSFLPSLSERNGSVEVAVVHHHRMAFYYWMEWTTNSWNQSIRSDEPGPDLVTVDWHDDVGCEDDCLFEELRSLVLPLEVANGNDPGSLDDVLLRQMTSKNNVAAYCYLGLRSLNDGHIVPAQYLNAIGNVYVLYKQRGKECEQMTDRYGNQHAIHYFKKTGDLLKKLDQAGPRPTYFDLDVDYFFRQGRGAVHGAEVMVPEAAIRSLLDMSGDLMQHLWRRPLRGLTIALEPTYCGGLNGCSRALNVICDALFDGSLLGHRVDWRKPQRKRYRR